MTSPNVEIGDRIRVRREEGPDFIQVTEGIVTSISSTAYFAESGGMLGYKTDAVSILQKDARYENKFVCGSWSTTEAMFVRIWDDPIMDTWDELYDKWLYNDGALAALGDTHWAAFRLNGITYVDDKDRGRISKAGD